MDSILERFLIKVDKESSSRGCWRWKGAQYVSGYGKFTFHGRLVPAHRVAHELLVGPIPPGLFVLHACDDRLCVCPDHLSLGTHADNMRDMRERGRGAKNHPNAQGEKHWSRRSPEKVRRGDRHHMTRLSDAQIALMRRLRVEKGVSISEMACLTGLGLDYVQALLSGRRRPLSD